MNQAVILFLVAGLTVCAQDNQSAVQSNLDRMISNARKSVAPASKSPPASPVPADIPMRSAENAPSVASGQVTSGRDTTLITNSVTEQGAGLESLAHGLYYKRRGDEWKKLEVTTSTGFRTTHGASSLVGVPPGAVRFFGGSESANQFDNGHPIFGIKVDVAHPETPGLSVRDLLIVRVAKKKDLRELEVMGGGFGSVRVGLGSKDVVEGVLTTVADGTFTLIPKSELARGEYLITFRGANGTAGYDFGVRSATFSQSPTKRIFIDPASRWISIHDRDGSGARNELTMDILKSCPAVLGVTDGLESADYTVSFSRSGNSVGSVLIYAGGTVAHSFKPGHTSTLKKVAETVCAFVGPRK